MAYSASYRFDLDLLKCLAIIAVVFYHIGWLQTGYLGVDVFFVINGFFILPIILKQISGGEFQYVGFLLKRVMRLWPLTLLASAVTLAIGACGMLPDDFENLSQSVIATDLMSTNILSAITTKNYWDVVNEYKPLMHFWYVGILIEFYILMPLVLLLVNGISKLLKKDCLKCSVVVVWLLFFSSLSLYLFSDMSQGDKFYYLPCRLFEILGGGLVGIHFGKQTSSKSLPFLSILGMGIVVLLMIGAWILPTKMSSEINAVTGQISTGILVPSSALLLATVLFTCVALMSKNVLEVCGKWKVAQGMAFIGKMSFSIFVWHQILLAFYRYFVSDDMSLSFCIGLLIVTLLLSLLSYYGIEQRVRSTFRNFGYCVAFMLLTIIPAGWIYMNAGVIRDVPELDVKRGNVHRGMYAEYCDRVYQYNHDFSETDKLKVLVEGVSFGRDFANILLESEWANKIELSYIFEHDENYHGRYEECDFLFTFSSKEDVPAYVWNSLKSSAKVFGLGTKNFGNNGVIYQKRKDANYYRQTTIIDPNFYTLNEAWKKSWGKDNYIDFLQLSTASNGEIRVFSDDNKFISQDGRHLTRNGARWFAKRIDWDSIFGR